MKTMNIVRILVFLAAATLGFTAPMAYAQSSADSGILTLDGKTLTPETLAIASREGWIIEVTADAWGQVAVSHRILIEAAKNCQKIYGLTTGVGANKDRSEFDCDRFLGADGELSTETVANSEAFNTSLLYAHAAGVGPALPTDIVRAILITRLNAILFGGTGMSEEMARQYQSFLNADIMPVIPMRGSMGEADITVLSHIGLAMAGEWEVFHDGERVPAEVALKRAGLTPIQVFGKDSLASFSSNAYTTALGALAWDEFSDLSAVSKTVFAASLEGLNGNVTPFLVESNALRPFPEVVRASEHIRALLDDSYLWAPSDTRPLQDPLSYRTAAFGFGALDAALDGLHAVLLIQLNGSDDNPGIFIGAPDARTASLDRIRQVSAGNTPGAVIPTANFSPLPLVLAIQRMSLAAAHVSQSSAMRIIKLADPHITGLPRFLSAPDSIHAFGAIQKPFVALASENRSLADPVSLDYFAVAQGIEDVATNGPRAARNARRIADNLRIILGFELMHAAQAIDLRRQSAPEIAISSATDTVLAQYRRRVPFLSRDDQILTNDIRESRNYLAGCRRTNRNAAITCN